VAAENVAKLTQPVTEQDHYKGNLKAQVKIVEYGDYECQFCARAHPIVEDLQNRLGDRICYVFRHFPIRTAHTHAQLAAEAAEAAGAQGKFWEMHAYLFEHQSELDRRDILAYAEDLGLDIDQFTRDLDEKRFEQHVRGDFLGGVRSGVNGTPTFFINGLRYDGPWDLESLLEAIEKPMGVRIRLLAQEFSSMAASGGIVLLLATLIALFWANSPWGADYFHLLETSLSINFGDLTLSEHLLEWVNDGLMVLFFFVVGLEIKREITAGELASPKKAALPIAAAVGGMVGPALIYVLFNLGGENIAGWGIPMATDIAFTLGIMALLGNRVPLSLKVFFTALAIADDLGAVLVIAIFYTSHIEWIALGIGAVIFLALIGLNRSRVYSPYPYAILGIGLWLAFLESGVHPTIAGVLLAMTIPTRSPANTGTLLAQCVTILDDYESPRRFRSDPSSQHQSAIQVLENITDRLQSPAQRLERDLHPWSTYLILPVFALSNAGVNLASGDAGNIFNPVSLGIIFGLVIGKPLGIFLASRLAVYFKVAEMPADLNWSQVFSASWLAGIGFTMSLFIANAAFDSPEILESAKLAILIASVIAGAVGGFLLFRSSPNYSDTTSVQVYPGQ
jgi:NhaA family Na+:H+ antiporter